jgi:hypothetical protein
MWAKSASGDCEWYLAGSLASHVLAPYNELTKLRVLQHHKAS